MLRGSETDLNLDINFQGNAALDKLKLLRFAFLENLSRMMGNG